MPAPKVALLGVRLSLGLRQLGGALGEAASLVAALLAELVDLLRAAPAVLGGRTLLGRVTPRVARLDQALGLREVDVKLLDLLAGQVLHVLPSQRAVRLDQREHDALDLGVARLLRGLDGGLGRGDGRGGGGHARPFGRGD
jgi:hypothetical protein